jgi:hypothetical protein
VTLRVKPGKAATDTGASNGGSSSAAATPSVPRALSGKCDVQDNDYAHRLNDDAATALDLETADDSDKRPILIISYVKPGDSYDPKWMTRCDESSPVAENPKQGYVDEPTVCLLGARHKWNQRELGNPYFPPNTSLIVYVIHEPRANASVTSPQAGGFSMLQAVPGNGVIAQAAGGASGNGPGSLLNGSKLHGPPRSSRHPNACMLDRYTLAPRPPGPFSVVSQLLDGDGAIVPGSVRVVEMLVDQRYFGAIRLGVGMSFSTYGNRSFSLHTTGSGATAIYQDAYMPFVPEIVAGFTVFPKPRYATAIRCGPHNLTECLWPPSPFVGIGLASSSPTGTFNILTSYYAGVEFQLGFLTVQASVGVRRDTVLAAGFDVGSVVPTGTTAVPTVSRYDFAPAVSLTLDADVLRVAGITVP